TLCLLAGGGCYRGPELSHRGRWPVAPEVGRAGALDGRRSVPVPGPVETRWAHEELLDHDRADPQPRLGCLVAEGWRRVSHVIRGERRARLAARARPRA